MSCRKNPILQLEISCRLREAAVTMDKMTTQGRFNLDTIAWDSVDLPDPELPAIPMMLTLAHGGE